MTIHRNDLSIQKSSFTIGKEADGKNEINDNVISTSEINTVVEPQKQDPEPVSPSVKKRWEGRIGKENNFKYKLESAKEGSKGLTYYVGDNTAEWQQLREKRVQYDVPFDVLEKMSDQALFQLWKEKYGDVAENYFPGEEEIIKLRNELVQQLNPDLKEKYNSSLISGEDSGATWILMKETDLYEKFKLLAITQCYHQFKKIREEAALDTYEKKARPVSKGSAGIRSGKSTYERQDSYSSNCFCCAGSKIINNLLGEKEDAKVLDQKKVRNFVPRFLSRQAYGKIAGGDDYDSRKNDILLFAGEDKGAYGNFFAVSDILFDEEKYGGLGRRNIALHKADYILGGVNNETAQNNIIEAIKKKIREVTGTGRMLMLGTHGHYVTITGIDNDNISYLDSLPEGNSTADEVQTKDIRKFLLGKADSFDTVELNWASKIGNDAPESLKKEFSGLGIDDKTGEVISTNKIKGSEDMAHRAGIVVVKSRDELIAQGNGDIARYMAESICLHRGAFMNKSKLDEWAKKDLEDWENRSVNDAEKEISTLTSGTKKETEKSAAKEKSAKADTKEYTESDLAMQEEAINVLITRAKDQHEKYLKDNKDKDNGGGLVRPSAEFVYGFDKGFDLRTDLSGKDRDDKSRNRRSRLYTKKENARLLLENITKGSEEERKNRNDLKAFYKEMMSREDYEAMSVLFAGKNKLDKAMVCLMSGYYQNDMNEKIEIAGAYKVSARRQALDLMTDHLLSIPLSKIDLSDDENFINHAAELQNIKLKLDAYKRFYLADEGYPAYVRTNTVDGDERYMKLQLRLKQLEALTEYYEAKKSLMTDETYKSHYDEELGIICEENAGGEQKKIAAKLIRMRRSAINLSKAFGRSAKGERLIRSAETAQTWQEKGRLLAVNAVENCSTNDRLVSMARFQMGLIKWDSSGHSKAYLEFTDNFQKLFSKMQEIAMREEKDNLPPDDLVELRRLYDITLKSGTDYMRFKRMDNRNRTYVERYRIVNGMLEKLRTDKDNLFSQPAFRSMSLSDALTKKGTGTDSKEYLRNILEDELGNTIVRENEDVTRLSELQQKALLLENKTAHGIANYIFGSGTSENDEVPTIDNLELISERMAERVLAMDRDHLFYRFGTGLNRQRWEAIWERVEILKNEITQAMEYGKNKRLQIVKKDEFSDFIISDEDKAWIPPFEELKATYENRRPLGTVRNTESFRSSLDTAVADYDDLLMKVFFRSEDEMSFDEEIRAFGEESLKDMFYIDGKRAVDVLAGRIEQYRRTFNDPDIAERAFKAELMSVIRERKYQITVAHWRRGTDGFYEPVMTDLNLSSGRLKSRTIEDARRKRLSRFAAIKAAMEKRKSDRRQEASLVRWEAARQQLNANNGAFSSAVDIFMKEREEDRSDEFIAIRRALDSMYTTGAEDSKAGESLIMMLSQGRFDWSPLNYAKLTVLFESLVTYLATHRKAGTEGQRRIDSASALLGHLKSLMHERLGKNAKAPADPGEVPEDKREGILDNVHRMASYYRKYSARVGEDTVASADEKLQRRWDMLKSVEEDILFFEREKAPEDLELDEKYLLEQYHSIREYIKLRNVLRKNPEIADKLGNKRSSYIKEMSFKEMGYKDSRKDKRKLSVVGLSKAQLAGIREIDHWVLRNFKNGGYMSFGLNTVERTDIVDRLMAMSPRERLYIYYVVQNRDARKNPKVSDILSAHLDYTPDLEAFKKQIRATPLKFYTRFSGGYIYWNKLTQAMAMCEGSREMLEFIDIHAREKEKALKDAANKQADDSRSVSSYAKEEDYNQIDRKLSNMIITTVDLTDVLKKTKNKKIKKNDAKRIAKHAKELQTRLKEEMNEIMDLKMRLSKKVEDFEQKKKSTGIEDTEKTIKIYGSELSTLLTLDSLLHNASTAICSMTVIDILDDAAPIDTALGTLGNILTVIFYVRAFLKNGSGMTEFEKTSNSFGMILKSAETLRTGTHFFKTIGKDAKFIDLVSSSGVSVVLTSFSLVLAVGKSGYNYQNQFDRLDGVGIAKAKQAKGRYEALQSGKKEEQDRYRDGLLRLDELLNRKEHVDTGYTMGGSAVSVATTAIICATSSIGAVLSGGLLAVLTGAAFTIAGIAKGHLAKFGQRKRREIVSSFFNVDDMVKQAENDWRREHNGEKMSSRQQARLKRLVLYRIAANLGYYSPSQLSHRLAKGFAKYLLDGAKVDGPTGDMCISFIKGIGVPFEMDPDTKVIKKPTASDIESSLCS